MSKTKVFIAMSLDGYIAGENESLEWLFNVKGDGDNGYGAFYQTINTVVMGRKTYDWITQQLPGEFPYADKKTYIITSKPLENSENLTFFNGQVERLIEELTQELERDVWIVGGGVLISTLLKKYLIDEMIITVAPVILGKGTPLFKNIEVLNGFNLHSIQSFGDFVEMHYIRN